MNRKIVIGILSSLLLVGLLLWLFDPPDQDAVQKELSAAWEPEYGIRSEDPRGLGFFSELLDEHLTDSASAAASFAAIDSIAGSDNATFLFVGNEFALTDTELDTLLNRVDSGALLFLGFDQLSGNAYTAFFEDNAYYWEYSDRTYVAMEDTSLVYCNVFQNDTICNDWYTFAPEAIKDTLYKAFAFSMYNPVAFELRRGKGAIILHSMPQLFMNYQVIRPNGFTHTSYMLRKIPRDRPVIWLECARWNESQLKNSTGNSDNAGGDKDHSYLQYIMSNESLRWAFMLAILALLLYVLFRSRRREAVLAGVPEKRNMSLAFVETLSSIYLSRNSPYGILQVLRRNFYMAVNRHFYIDLLSTHKREEDIKRLLEKASAEEENLREILTFLETKPEDQRTVDEVTLGKVYRSIRMFYVQTGISPPADIFVIGKAEVLLHRTLWPGAIAILLGMFALLRGLYTLSAGGGYGILLVAGSFIFLYLGIRFLSKPVARITETAFTLYKPLFGEKTLDLTTALTYNRTKTETTLHSEKGEQLSVSHAQLSRAGRHALNLFLAHIKQQSA